MTKLRKLAGTVAALGGVLVFGQAHADVITGELWHVPESVVTFGGTGGSAASIPATAADATFNVNAPLTFWADNSGASSVATWLASGSAFNIVENTPGTLASLLDGMLNDAAVGTVVHLSGMLSVFNGESFTLTHDDGITLTINGFDVISSPGPIGTTPTTGVYGGATGTFAFDLYYAECCGGNAVLQGDLASVPEPDTLGLLGISLFGVAFGRRRLRK